MEKNIYEKLSAITTELTAVAKNLSVGEGRSSYKAVGEADVLAAVKPLEAKHRIFSYPSSRRVIESDVITTEKEYNGTVTKSSKFFLRVETVYRFVDMDDPTSFIDITSYGDGIDPQDKAPGKACTYSDKYALLKAYKIITGDDPDQDKSEETAVKKTKPVCEVCGKQIKDAAPNAEGKVYTAKMIAEYSQARFKRVMCQSCQKAEITGK